MGQSARYLRWHFGQKCEDRMAEADDLARALDKVIPRSDTRLRPILDKELSRRKTLKATVGADRVRIAEEQRAPPAHPRREARARIVTTQNERCPAAIAAGHRPGYFFLAFAFISRSRRVAFSFSRFASARSSLGVLFLEPLGRGMGSPLWLIYDKNIIDSHPFGGSMSAPSHCRINEGDEDEQILPRVPLGRRRRRLPALPQLRRRRIANIPHPRTRAPHEKETPSPVRCSAWMVSAGTEGRSGSTDCRTLSV